MDYRRPASEFPNDNLDLHEGALWRCRSVTGAARAVARPKPPVACPASPEAAGESPADIPSPATAAPPTLLSPVVRKTIAPPPREPSVAFENLLRTLADVALARGATRAAAVVADLLRTGSVRADLLSRGAIDAGTAAGILTERSGCVALSEATYAVARAWRTALEDNGDLENIGHTTLDGFCSEVLAVIAADTASTDAIRRELRSRGVAAFGLLEVAA